METYPSSIGSFAIGPRLDKAATQVAYESDDEHRCTRPDGTSAGPMQLLHAAMAECWRALEIGFSAALSRGM